MKYCYLAFLFIISVFYSCSGSGDKVENESQTIETVLPEMVNEVTIMQLMEVEFNHELISNGKLSARNYADLYFQSTEPIAAIYVKNGDRVKKGQKLAELTPFRSINQSAQTGTALAQAKLELQDLLIGQGYALADSAKVPAETMRLVRIKSGYEQTLAQYELAVFEEKNAVLTAPFDGVVANLFAKPHNNATRDVFCTIIDTCNMEASFTVLENELPLIKQGDKVHISPYSMPDIVVDGRISEINPWVDENGMVQVKASVGSHPKLFEGMNIRASIQRLVGKQLVVPKEAAVLRSGKQVVFTLTPENKAYWNYVQTGLENSAHYTIIEGLKAGDKVIITGNINLAHDAPVRVVDNGQLTTEN
ncbi:MAG: efflux RND transporter periplasmic adaptor subunit [Tannerellaceae bacterium]|nr:efflux RND transporter periplasmic adaptor subunit [Tannerellaceae bacterium]